MMPEDCLTTMPTIETRLSTEGPDTGSAEEIKSKPEPNDEEGPEPNDKEGKPPKPE